MKKAELIELIEMRQREEADLYDEPEHAASPGTGAGGSTLMQTESANVPCAFGSSRAPGAPTGAVRHRLLGPIRQHLGPEPR